METQNNVANFTRWMAAENPPSDWWHLNNPLNSSLGSGPIDGTGSYADLDIAATYTARMIVQQNMATIRNALVDDAPLATFSAGCAYSAWSTGGYHDRPSYIASIPEPAVINGPAFPVPNPPTPSPAPSPAPPPAPAPQEETMIARDNVTGGVWVARANADVYTFLGAPYIGPLPKYTAAWGIGTPSNPVVGIVSDEAGGFVLAADNGGPEPSVYHITSDGAYAR